MNDYDIRIKNSTEVNLFGTTDNTITVPANVKLDSDLNRLDIDIKNQDTVKICLPNKAEKVELNITDSKLNIHDVSYDEFEIDGKGKITIDIRNVSGPIDINMIGGEAELIVHEGYSFRTVCKGKNNSINSNIPEDNGSLNVIELNGKDTVLNITLAE